MNNKTLSRGGALSDLLGEAVSNLKPELRDRHAPASAVIQVDPARTRMNDLHRRSDSSMSGTAIEEMVEMFKANGQAIPARGWKLKEPETDIEYILVYGARRRAAALALGIPLKLELLPEPPTRSEVIRLMHAENRGRLDYVPLEDAREYRAFLDSGEYKNAVEMSAALGQDSSKISRLLSLLDLPQEVLSLYSNPSWLTLYNGAKLASAIKSSHTYKAAVLDAVSIWKKSGLEGDPTPALLKALDQKPAPPVVIQLVASSGKKPVGSVHGNVDGNGPFSIRLSTSGNSELRRELADAINRHFKTTI